MKRTKQIFSAILMALMVFVLSGSGTYTAHAESVKPAKPALVSVTNKAAGIALKWKKAANASGYYILRKTSSASFRRIGEVKGQNTVTYTDKSVKDNKGTAYTYTVRAYNGNALSKFNAKGMKIVREYPVQIKLDKTKASLSEGATLTLKATASGKVSWSSSNPDVATVKNGKVTARKAGKTTITAKANGKTATCTVTVTKAVDYKTLYKNFLANYKPEDGGDMTVNRYFVHDVDGVGTPELLIVDYVDTTRFPLFPHYPIGIYTIVDNKVSLLTTLVSYYSGKITFNYSSTYDAMYLERGSTDTTMRRSYGLYKHISGSVIMDVYSAGYYSEGSSIKYFIGADPNSKEASKTEYDNYVKKYFSNIKRYEMLKNTPENRAKSFS